MEGEEVLIRQGRSLAETPSYSVASVVTVLVFVCFVFQRSIYRFGKWLKKTRRKALFVSLEKIKEELMLLGLISLLLAQCARWISEICVDSSLFSSKFYLCSEEDYGMIKNNVLLFESSSTFLNETQLIIPPRRITTSPQTISHQCGKGREPFVSLEGLEQLHRFLFVLGITHVLYSCLAVGLAMSKIYSWRKWENQTSTDGHLQAKINKVMRRQSTFVFHHTSHPWSRSRVLIWMLCFFRQFKSSIRKSDYLALRLGFITHGRRISWHLGGQLATVGICHYLYLHKYPCFWLKLSKIPGVNIYFWLSFIPAILVMLVGTKLQHVVSTLALEIGDQTGPSNANQVKPRDGLFWFGKPEILLRLIQFIIFQNAFEMATFIWSLWGFKQRSCFMKNHFMIITRLASGVLVQFWCSYSTVPLNVIITQMGSRCKKALVAESVRESLHSWCKRVKERSKRDSALSVATRSVCSIDEEEDEITVASGTLSLSRSSSASLASLNEVITDTVDHDPAEQADHPSSHDHATPQDDDEQVSLRIQEYLKDSTTSLQPPAPAATDHVDEEDQDQDQGQQPTSVVTLSQLFGRS